MTLTSKWGRWRLKKPASRLFIQPFIRSKKTPKLRVTGLCEGNSPVTGEFPAQKISDAENVPIWWRHHTMHEHLCCLTVCYTNNSHTAATITWHRPGKSEDWPSRLLSCPQAAVNKPQNTNRCHFIGGCFIGDCVLSYPRGQLYTSTYLTQTVSHSKTSDLKYMNLAVMEYTLSRAHSIHL